MSADGTTRGVDDLDRLSPSELDELPLGVIQVDGHGDIHLYNAAESRLSGRCGDRILGRNLFTEIAPCTNIPGFAGRFRDGVAAGALDVSFEFVFAFRMAPVSVGIRMWRAAGPDRYWITVRKIADVAPNRPAEARAIVAARADGVSMDVADHTICDREPIHLAGAVQPWSALLAVDPRSGVVVAASANATGVFGREARPGLALRGILEPATAQSVLAASDAAPDHDGVVWSGETRGDPVLDVAVHRSGGLLIVEAEPVAGRDDRALAAVARRLARATAALRAAATIEELGRTAVAALRAMTGFERVVLYRFDTEGHGEVVAEDMVPDWDQSFAGLHFPAGDIPRQARALYTRTVVRHVADGDHIPVPVHALEGTAPVDLSLARGRSLSPIHLEYHRNMGVNGAMSLSVLTHEGLWGLLICHHRAPHFVDVSSRAAAATLAETVAALVRTVGLAAAERDRRRDQTVLNDLMVGMAGHDDLLCALVDGRPNIKDLFGATGVAVCIDGRTALVGATPPTTFVTALVEWLSDRWQPGGRFVTDTLSATMPEAVEHRETASGLLALDLGDGAWVLWMKAEEPRVICWAGAPEKIAGKAGVPLPRASFERWVEERRGYAAPWDPWAPEVALSLRHAVRDVLLRHLREVRALSAQLEESNRVKARFMANMSHELRTPLNAILGFADLMRSGAVGPLSPRHAEYLDDIHGAGVHLLAMVNDVLDMSRIDAGRLEIRIEPVAVGEAIGDAMALMRPRADQRGVRLRADVGGAVAVMADRVRLRQILLNLLSNAVKFTPSGGTVEITTTTGGATVDIRVVDSGPGMTPGEIALAMEPFRHDVGPTRPEEAGTGLGLPIVKALTALLGGRLRLTSTPGVGTVATVSLPTRHPANTARAAFVDGGN